MTDERSKAQLEEVRVRNGEMVDSEEKGCLETDSCLNKTPQEEEKKRRRFKDKVKDRCACLALTWRGIVVLFILVLLALLLLIVVIVLAVNMDCFGFSPRAVCQRPECLRLGAGVLEKMNTSAEPCRDFFEYACGGWAIKQMHEERLYSYGRYTALDDHVHHYHDMVRRRLTTMRHTTNVSSLPWKMKAFYDSCTNVDAVDAAGIMPLKRLVDTMRGWSIIHGSWSSSVWDFDSVLRQLQARYDVHPFFRVTVQSNHYVPGSTVIQIEPSGLGMPNRVYYHRRREDKVVDGYYRLLIDIASSFEVTRNTAYTFADDIFNFERRIAMIYPEERFNKLQMQQKPITIQKLQQSATRIRWIDHLNALFHDFHVTDGTQVMANITYLNEISRIISSTDSSILNSYLMWTLVRQYIPYLSLMIRKPLDEYNHRLTGSYRPMDRWKFCIEEMEKLFPIATVSLFAEYEIPRETYSNVSLLFAEIIKGFGNRIYYYKWMDERTRQIAMEKVKGFRYKAVVPPFLNSSYVSHHYLGLNIMRSDFFTNILKGVEFRNRLQVTWLRNASEFHRFHSLTALDLLPFIDSSNQKTMVISPILLHRYFFDYFQPASVNFGALGTLIARTLVNAMEDADDYDREWKYHMEYRYNYFERHREKERFIPQWWSNYTLDRYERHQNCVATEYFKYYIPYLEINQFGVRQDVYVNGNRTLRENFADIAGLTIAYHAFENWQWSRGRDKYLPALQNRTQNQMFFISYAQSLCSVDRSENLLRQLEFSDFSPNKIRVNGALAHSQDFVWTYGCSYRYPMNAYYKCETW